jgi:hypothetical protein
MRGPCAIVKVLWRVLQVLLLSKIGPSAACSVYRINHLFQASEMPGPAHYTLFRIPVILSAVLLVNAVVPHPKLALDVVKIICLAVVLVCHKYFILNTHPMYVKNLSNLSWPRPWLLIQVHHIVVFILFLSLDQNGGKML